MSREEARFAVLGAIGGPMLAYVFCAYVNGILNPMAFSAEQRLWFAAFVVFSAAFGAVFGGMVGSNLTRR